jgi:signal transduction histidine kinase
MEEKLLAAMRWATLVACALPSLDAFLGAPAPSPSRGLFLAGLLLFVAAFWLNTRQVHGLRSTWEGTALLMAQLPACFLVPELLFALALEAPLVLAGRRLRYWAAVQGLATLAVLGAHAPAIFIEVPEYKHLSAGVAIGLHILYWLAWQAIIVTAAVLTAHAIRSRRELARLHAELGATEELLSEGARSAERVSLAREVNDAMGHHLAELILRLELAAQRACAPADLALRSAQSLSRHLLSEVREILGALPPAIGGVHVDLGAALRTFAAGIEGPELRLSLPQRLEVSPVAAHVAFRCVQEAITNTLRHSGAQNVWIDLRCEAGALELQVRDDGRGTSSLHEGYGLLGMRSRVEEAGGQIRMETASRQGFALSVTLPLDDAVEPRRPASVPAP